MFREISHCKYLTLTPMLLVVISCSANSPSRTSEKKVRDVTQDSKNECEISTDCTVIASYCGGWASVATDSIEQARLHYDSIGKMKDCPAGTAPKPTPSCKRGQCSPKNIWNSKNTHLNYAEEIELLSGEWEGKLYITIPTTQKQKEEALAAIAQTIQKKRPRLLEKSWNYRMQYFLTEDKKLFTNFFCETMGSSWKKKLLVIDDGGDCFFQAIYDFTSKKVDLTINGEA